jgi:DNA-binding NtrC family response regulator
MNALQTVNPPSRVAGKRVLVLDDNPHICLLMKAWLQAMGHTVETGERGRDFVKGSLGETADVVITDIMMTDGDGFEVIEAVKAAHPGTKVIAMSGGGSYLPGLEYLKLARILGADEVLLKPFTQRHVVDVLTRVCS